MGIESANDGGTFGRDLAIDEMEVGRCSCGLVFYSTEYLLNHICLGHPDPDDPWYAGNYPATF